jgi:acetyltransferase-like isoleucine patch superfamily enzyme
MKAKVNPLFRLIGYVISMPARFKGMQFGNNSFIGLGYDWMFSNLSGVSVGNNVLIGANAFFSSNGNSRILIGNNTHIGRNFTASSNQLISIGSNVLMSYGVSILDHDHEFRNIHIAPINAGLTEGKDILIEDDCFIGARAFILKGVHLGRHCVVAANSVVTKSYPSYSVIGGNPAKLIKMLH